MCIVHTHGQSVLKAIEDVASGTMSLVAVTKTRRCSGFGELVADAIAKGEPYCLEGIECNLPDARY